MNKQLTHTLSNFSFKFKTNVWYKTVCLLYPWLDEISVGYY